MDRAISMICAVGPTFMKSTPGRGVVGKNRSTQRYLTSP